MQMLQQKSENGRSIQIKYTQKISKKIWDKRKRTPTRCLIRPRGYKTFFHVNSAEHEILNAHKYKKKYQEFQLF